MPMRYWLIAFRAPGQSRDGTYYSIVLPDGSVDEPKVSRQNLTASANPVDVSKDTKEYLTTATPQHGFGA